MVITSPRAAAVAFRGVPTTLNDEAQHRRLLAEAINTLMQGKANNTGDVTLTANEASTTVTDARVSMNTKVTLTPETANAATEFGAGTWRIASGDGSFVITHVNNAQTDRTFGYVLNG